MSNGVDCSVTKPCSLILPLSLALIGTRSLVSAVDRRRKALASRHASGRPRPRPEHALARRRPRPTRRKRSSSARICSWCRPRLVEDGLAVYSQSGALGRRPRAAARRLRRRGTCRCVADGRPRVDVWRRLSSSERRRWAPTASKEQQASADDGGCARAVARAYVRGAGDARRATVFCARLRSCCRTSTCSRSRSTTTWCVTSWRTFWRRTQTM